MRLYFMRANVRFLWGKYEGQERIFYLSTTGGSTEDKLKAKVFGRAELEAAAARMANLFHGKDKEEITSISAEAAYLYHVPHDDDFDKAMEEA